MADPLLDEDTYHRLLRAAKLAPAIHHTRPWGFRSRGSAIEVYRDPTREVSGGDPTPNGVLISIGAAILNLRAAAAYFGFDSTVRALPDTEQPLEAALIRLTPRPPDEVRPLATLYRYLYERKARRVPEHGRLTVPIRADLRAAAVLEGAALEWISDPIRRGRLDRTFRTARHQRPSIAVLSTAHDHPADQLAAGLALQRVRLTAAGYGLVVSPPPHRMERHELRSLVRDPRRGWVEPHIVVWFGIETHVPALPHTEVDEFLLDSSGLRS